MQIAKDTATRSLTVAGVGLSIPAPFLEGHVCTTNEASVLNQILGENVRNNIASKVKAAIEKAGAADKVDIPALQAVLDEYVGKYEFGVRRGGGGGRTAMNPEDSFKLAYAKTKVRNSLKKKGHVMKNIAASEVTRLATEALANNEALQKAAAKAWKIEQDNQDMLDIDIDTVETEAAAEASAE